MNATDALRFLAHEVERCKDRDMREAAVLWVPALCRVLGLRAADDFEAIALQEQAHRELRALNESPLVEAHCEACSFVETLPDCRFTVGMNEAFGRIFISKAWCNQCGAERFFIRREAVPA